jgi:hypothetical protein
VRPFTTIDIGARACCQTLNHDFLLIAEAARSPR